MTPIRPTHPAAEAWPPLDEDEYQVLVDGIRSDGLLQPIVRWRGHVVDGVHRLRVCGELGVTPRFEDLPDDADPWMVAARGNGGRRHMSKRERARHVALALEQSGEWRRELEERKEADRKARNASISAGKRSVSTSEPETSSEVVVGQKRYSHTAAKVAELAHVSPATARDAVREARTGESPQRKSTATRHPINYRKRRVNAERVVSVSISALEGICLGFEGLDDLSSVDDASTKAKVIGELAAQIRRFARRLK